MPLQKNNGGGIVGASRARHVQLEHCSGAAFLCQPPQIGIERPPFSVLSCKLNQCLLWKVQVGDLFSPFFLLVVPFYSFASI